jgi:hypothetical protein
MTRIAWSVFAAVLLFAILFLANTVSSLPPLIASHFDAAGTATAQMSRGTYTKFVFFMGVGLPIAMVAFLTLIYSNARDMKMPNRDYWLAPERIAHTRAVLVSHGVWFGCLMSAMVCYVHWLILEAHRTVPPHLSGPWVAGGMFTLLAVSGGWIIALLRYFRGPPVVS